MNDEFADLENELRALEPRAASRQLTDQIHTLIDGLPSQSVRPPWWQRLGFNRPTAAICWGLGSPALTAVVAVATLHFIGAEWIPFPSRIHDPHGNAETVSSSPFSPASNLMQSNAVSSAKAANVVYQTLDDGVVANGAQEPVRRLRYRSAALVEWRNPNTGANWEIAYPREDVVLVPIQAQ